MAEHAHDAQLLEAADRGDAAALSAALAAGADVNALRHSSYMLDVTTEINAFTSPLHITAEKGHLDCVRVLVDQGARIDTPDDTGATPLLLATRAGHEPVARLLLDRGASATAPAGQGDDCPLACAAAHNMTSVLPALLHLDRAPGHLARALDQAVARNHVEAIDLVMAAARNSGLSEADSAQIFDRALQSAASSDRLASLDRLLPLASDHARDAALRDAARAGHLAIVRRLVESRATIDAGDQVGWSALMYAVWEGHADVVDYLLTHGADDARRDTQGHDALHWAAENPKAERIALTLLARRPKVEPCAAGRLLLSAAQHGQAELARALIALGASVETKNVVGWTPLMLAAYGNHHAAVRTLLDAGADVTACNPQNHTAADLATSAGHRSLAGRLKPRR